MRVTLTNQADGRGARRRAAMLRVQVAALDLFEAHGFEAVSVEAIAAAAEVGPATVYRHFGGKEAIVLWDEYDPLLFAGLADALADAPPLVAVQRALGKALSDLYARDRERILRRARLIAATPALTQANAAGQAALRRGLAAVLREHGGARDDLEAAVFAGAIAATLEAAADAWLADGGASPLGRHLTMAFRRLARLTAS